MKGIEDRVERRDLIGRTEGEILDEFGSPESGPIFRDWDANYWIRQHPSCVDDYWLLIDYQDGRVEAAIIVED